MRTPNESAGLEQESTIAWMIGVGVLFVAAVLGIVILFDVDKEVLQLLGWLDGQGVWGPLLFTLFMVFAVVLLLPGVLFTTGAGFVFGVTVGSTCVVIGTTLGAALAFLTARHLFGERTARLLLHHAKLQLVSEELELRGWKVVLLTRLMPFFPFKLSNYFFGLTGLSLRSFVGGTFAGIIPLSVHNVYLGSIAADVATLGQRHGERGLAMWVLYGVGFVVSVGLVIYLNRLARAALAKGVEPTKGEPHDWPY